MKLGELLDLLVEEYINLAEAEHMGNEWIANQHRGYIVDIRSALNNHYTPEQMVKVETMIDSRIQSYFS